MTLDAGFMSEETPLPLTTVIVSSSEIIAEMESTCQVFSIVKLSANPKERNSEMRLTPPQAQSLPSPPPRTLPPSMFVSMIETILLSHRGHVDRNFQS